MNTRTPTLEHQYSNTNTRTPTLEHRHSNTDTRTPTQVLQVASGSEHSLALVLECGPVTKYYEKDSGHRVFELEDDDDDDGKKAPRKRFWFQTKIVAWGLNDGRLGID